MLHIIGPTLTQFKQVKRGLWSTTVMRKASRLVRRGLLLQRSMLGCLRGLLLMLTVMVLLLVLVLVLTLIKAQVASLIVKVLERRERKRS